MVERKSRAWLKKAALFILCDKVSCTTATKLAVDGDANA